MIKTILLIGLGGIGSNLIKPIAKLAEKNNILLTVADGDFYEHRNKERQNLPTEMKNVSKGLTGGLDYSYSIGIGHYINSENISTIFKLLPKPLLVICAVDNNATRKLTLEEISNYEDEIHWLSPSNDEDSTVQISYYSNKVKGINPLERYENIANPNDTVPTHGCEKQYDTYPQLLRTNVVAAALTVSLTHDLLVGNNIPVEITMNLNDYISQGIYLSC